MQTINTVPTVSVIIPVYENAASLPPLFAALRDVERQLAERGCTLELICVDDGSTDESLATLLDLRTQRPTTIVIKLARNFGAIRAIKAGLRRASGNCCTWISADLQDPPDLIVGMVVRWLDGATYVIATREARDDPAATALLSRLFHRLARLMVARTYPAGGFDIVLVDETLAPYLRDSGRRANLALLSFRLGVKPVYVTYQRQRRPFGKSRWTLAKRAGYAADSLLAFSPLPLRVAVVVGAALAVASAGCGAVMAAAGRDPLALLGIAVCLLLGVVVALLGLIGEYVWRIYEEISGVPDVVVEAVYAPEMEAGRTAMRPD